MASETEGVTLEEVNLDREPVRVILRPKTDASRSYETTIDFRSAVKVAQQLAGCFDLGLLSLYDSRGFQLIDVRDYAHIQLVPHESLRPEFMRRIKEDGDDSES